MGLSTILRTAPLHPDKPECFVSEEGHPLSMTQPALLSKDKGGTPVNGS